MERKHTYTGLRFKQGLSVGRLREAMVPGDVAVLGEFPWVIVKFGAPHSGVVVTTVFNVVQRLPLPEELEMLKAATELAKPTKPETKP